MEHNTNNIYDTVQMALNNLSSDTIKGHELHMSKELFFKEFRFLALTLPRRSGATTAAKALISTYNNSLLIVPSDVIAKNIQDKYNETKIIPYKKITPNWFRGRLKLELIIIDSCKMISNEDINRVINNLKHFTKLFVVLG